MALVTFSITAPQQPVCVGDQFSVTLTVDSSAAAINIVDGGLVYDVTQLNAISLKHGMSFVQYWVNAPDVSSSPGYISFTGGLPTPGYQGNGGSIMAVVFEATREGQTGFAIERDTTALLDDGNATEADVVLQSGTMSVLAQEDAACTGREAIIIGESDNEPPLPFSIEIAKSENAFNGDYFASFFTTDADSGVAYYEVAESSSYISSQWMRSDSPYLLKTQGGDVQIKVRAVDHAGNIREEMVSDVLVPRSIGTNTGDLVLLMIAGALAVFMLWHCWKNRDRE